MRAVREDDSFEPSGASSGTGSKKPSPSPSSDMPRRVVRVGDKNVTSALDVAAAQFRCYRCPPDTEKVPWSELAPRMGLCEKHWQRKIQQEAQEQASYLSDLREYAELTGDARVADYADWQEQEGSLSDPRREGMTHQTHEEFRQWRSTRTQSKPGS